MYRNFVAKSPQMLDIISVVTKIAPTNSPVLIHGENGVGKSIIAEQIHLKSFRHNDLFVRINCFSNSNQLLESEIFGNDFSNQKNEGGLKLSFVSPDAGFGRGVRVLKVSVEAAE